MDFLRNSFFIIAIRLHRHDFPWRCGVRIINCPVLNDVDLKEKPAALQASLFQTETVSRYRNTVIFGFLIFFLDIFYGYQVLSRYCDILICNGLSAVKPSEKYFTWRGAAKGQAVCAPSARLIGLAWSCGCRGGSACLGHMP